MILGGKHVQGIYLYDPTADYEKDDFVVDGNILWVVTASEPTNKVLKTVSGQVPSENPKNFRIYPGEAISTAKEYLDYASDPNSHLDKFVSTRVLAEILNTYSFGYDHTGVITEGIFEGTPSSSLAERMSREQGTALDRILRGPSLNNAALRIDRNLPELAGLMVGGQGESEGLLLRQYTYYDTKNVKDLVRVQELLDPITSKVIYRFSKDEGFRVVSEWRDSNLGGNFKDEVSFVKATYQRKITELDLLKTQLKERFAFAPVKITKGPSITLQTQWADQEGFVDVNSFETSPTLVTIIIREYLTQLGVHRNHSITIDPSDSFGSRPVENYLVGDSGILSITGVSVTRMTVSSNVGEIIQVYSKANGGR